MFNFFFKKNLKQKVEANKMHNKLKLIKNHELRYKIFIPDERNLKNLPSCRDNFGDDLDEKDGDGGVGVTLASQPHHTSHIN